MEFNCYTIEIDCCIKKNLKKGDSGSFQNQIWNKNRHIKKLELGDLAQWFHTIWHIVCIFNNLRNSNHQYWYLKKTILYQYLPNTTWCSIENVLKIVLTHTVWHRLQNFFEPRYICCSWNIQKEKVIPIKTQKAGAIINSFPKVT